jgi:hypothetical protein
MRKLVIFGNGLGRALDDEFFQLERALMNAWADPTILNDDQKSLIHHCLPMDVIEVAPDYAPKSELELDRLQRVLAACDELTKHETENGASWLTDDGKMFPFAIRSYIHRAASYFHGGGHALPNEFAESLRTWILKSRSHVATLNYDELLYRAFINTPACQGYSCLLDGFVPDFKVENLSRYNPAQQSYYLHLHGSPLYFNSTLGDLRKASLSQLPSIEGHSSSHLVLTHVDHKAAVISASPILREYWKCLEVAMSEASGVVLFGYGGGDTHLNLLISRHFREKQVEIVERKTPNWQGQESVNVQCQKWQNLLGVKRVVGFLLDDILSHRSWEWENPAPAT